MYCIVKETRLQHQNAFNPIKVSGRKWRAVCTSPGRSMFLQRLAGLCVFIPKAGSQRISGQCSQIDGSDHSSVEGLSVRAAQRAASVSVSSAEPGCHEASITACVVSSCPFETDSGSLLPLLLWLTAPLPCLEALNASLMLQKVKILPAASSTTFGTEQWECVWLCTGLRCEPGAD